MIKIHILIKRFLIITALIAGIFLIHEQFVKSYAAWPTHSFLTGQMAELYNQFNAEKLTNQEIEWLKQGSVEEDDAPRWLNHFYDPTTGLGWNAHNLLMNSNTEMPPALTLIVQKVLIGGSAISAVDWFDNQAKQTEYADYSGDQSLTKAIQAYALGDKKTAFIALGHILHLAADMTVPAHTRQDTHSLEGLNDGDPYETWLKNENNLTIKNWQEIKDDYPSFDCADIKVCLIKLATYTNHYFFSKDTVDNEYEYPKILFKKIEIINNKEYEFGYGKDNQNNNFKLVFYSEDNKNNPIIDKNDYLNQNYYSRLSKQAIMGGAEIIKLFKEQADKMSAEEAKNQPIVQASQKLFSFLGDYLKIKPKVDSFMSELAMAGKAILAFYQQKAEMENAAAEKAVDLLYGFGRDNSKFDVGIAIDEPPLPSDQSIAVASNIQVILPPTVIQIINSTLEPIHEPYEALALVPNLPLVSTQNNPSVIPEKSGIQTEAEIQDTNLDPRIRKDDNYVRGDDNKENGNNNQSDPGAALPPNLSYEQPQSNPSPQPSPQGGEGGESDPPVIPANAGIQVEEPPADTTPPDIKIGLKNYKLTSLSLTVFWQSSSTDIGYYEAQWKKIPLNPPFSKGDEDWADWINNSSSTEQVFDASTDNTIYQFRARAVDLAGNKSAWQKVEAEICTKPVIINEIAWMGTGATSELNKDEWIELYNKSNQNLNLDGWSLIGGNGGPNIAFASTSAITAKNYFLIERTDDEAVSDIKADLITNFGNGLNDEGESLILKNKDGETIDALFNGEWLAGDKDNRRTMERVNPYLSADLTNNWQTNNGSTTNGLAADKITKIYGTPRADNSVFNPDYIIPAYTWAKPRIIDKDWAPGGVGGASIALDAEGNSQLIWKRSSSGSDCSAVYNFYNNNSWQSNYQYITRSNQFFNVLTPPLHFVMDNSNRPNMIFIGGNYIDNFLYFSLLDNGAWSAPLIISSTSTQAYYSTLAIGSDGRLHVAWETNSPDYQIYYRSFDSSTGWSNIVKISSSSDITRSPILIVDKNNEPRLTWFEYAKTNGINGIGIYYAALSGDIWSAPQKILDYQGVGISHPDTPAMTIDENNILHLVWSDIKDKKDKGDIYYSRYDGNAWLAPINISGSTSMRSRLPDLTIDKDGKLYAVWAEEVNNKDQIFFTYSDTSQNIWEASKSIESDSQRNFSYPKIIAGDNGRLYLSWNSYGIPSPTNLYYSHTEF